MKADHLDREDWGHALAMNIASYADAVEQVYAASMDPDAWARAMETIRTGFEALAVAFLAAAPHHRPIMASAGLSDEARATYEAYYGRLDYVAQRFQRGNTHVDVALPSAAFAAWPDRRKHEFFRDWSEP